MIGTSNTVNGKPVYYLFQKPGAVIDATNRAGTVYGIDSPGIIIRDVTLTNSTTGVLLFNSDSAQVQNVTTGGNQVGVSISGCNDLVVNNSISSGNSFTGFDIQDSANVTLQGVTANENSNPLPETGSGISIDTGSNVYIINATTDRNKYAGIEISGSDRTILFGITASRNGIAGLIINGDRTRVMG
jgi:nitrous oxidase accessory protein NosD